MIRLLVLLLVIASAAPALAFERTRNTITGACAFWPTRAVPWLLNEKGSADTTLPDLQGALGRAFGAWQDVACSDMGFTGGQLTPRIDVGFVENSSDNANILIFRERTCELAAPRNDACFQDGTCPDLYDCWDSGGGIIALTTVNYARSTGRISDADIEFNGSPDRNGSEFRFTATVAETPACTSPGEQNCVATDVQNTAAHEIGHMLGFDHSPLADATMFGNADQGETKKRTLSPDDEEGLCKVYPTGQGPLTCTPSGTIGITPQGPANDGGCGCGAPGASLLALLGLLRRRGARR